MGQAGEAPRPELTAIRMSGAGRGREDRERVRPGRETPALEAVMGATAAEFADLSRAARESGPRPPRRRNAASTPTHDRNRAGPCPWVLPERARADGLPREAREDDGVGPPPQPDDGCGRPGDRDCGRTEGHRAPRTTRARRRTLRDGDESWSPPAFLLHDTSEVASWMGRRRLSIERADPRKTQPHQVL